MKYEVWSMNPKTRAKQTVPYFVEAHDQGRSWTCTCPDFVIRKKGKVNCKHIDYVIAHNKEQERIQADVMKSFESGWGFDLEQPEEKKPDLCGDDDVSVAPAS